MFVQSIRLIQSWEFRLSHVFLAHGYSTLNDKKYNEFAHYEYLINYIFLLRLLARLLLPQQVSSPQVSTWYSKQCLCFGLTISGWNFPHWVTSDSGQIETSSVNGCPLSKHFPCRQISVNYVEIGLLGNESNLENLEIFFWKELNLFSFL